LRQSTELAIPNKSLFWTNVGNSIQTSEVTRNGEAGVSFVMGIAICVEKTTELWTMNVCL
jgi:hypothetical protein